MAEPLSDYSKILELQEVKKHYDDLQERHSTELGERDNEIVQLRAQLEDLQGGQMAGAGASSSDENDRLTQQLAHVRQDYEAKIERLNARIRELSEGAGVKQPVAAQSGEKKGFFRR